MGSGWSILGDEQLSEPRWEEPPYRRGSFQILVECIITLLLCAWTAIHLNIPAPSPQKPISRNTVRKWTNKLRHINWKKALFLVLAMIAPEIISVIAYLQWKEKRALWKLVQELSLNKPHPDEEPPFPTDEERGEAHPLERMARESPSEIDLSRTDPRGALPSGSVPRNRRVGGTETSSSQAESSQPSVSAKPDGGIPPEPGLNQERLEWTETHCWYATIGGFVIQNYNGNAFPIPNGLKRLTLRPEGLRFFLRNHPHVFPKLRESNILDKSKANSLAKTLVCLQALWFCANMIGRVAQGLPLTVLELNTAAHCICTLVTYLFWWNKPYDVSQPTSIVLDRRTVVKAAMVCLLSWDGRNVKCIASKDGRRFFDLGITRHVRLWKRGSPMIPADSTSPDSPTADAQAPGSSTDITTRYRTAPQSLSAWKELTKASLRLFDPTTKTLSFRYTKNTLDNRVMKVKRTILGQRRFHFSWDCYPSPLPSQEGSSLVATHPQELRALLQLVDECDDGDFHSPLPEHSGSKMASQTTPELPFRDYVTNLLSKELLVFAISCTVYAAIHALGWNGPFHTTAEVYLWRLSVLAFAPFYGWLILGVHLALLIQTFVPNTDIVENVTAGVFVFTFLATICAFPVGRTFLMVESFLALPYAPPGAFDEPIWSAYFPHFG